MNTLLQKQFGFDYIEIKELNGYDNVNYLITTGNGKYIFKTYLKNAESLALVEAENKTLLFLQNNKDDKFPRPIPFTDGSFVKILNIDGKETICRILSFLEGEFLGDVTHTERLFQSFGIFLAQTDIKLQKFIFN